MSGILTNGGALVISNIGTNAPAAGDTFTLFSASSYAGSFTSLSLPVLPVGLLWNTSGLITNGTLVVLTNTGSSFWNGGGTNGNWSTAGNWNGTLPVNGQFLTFQGTLRQSNTNDLLTSVGQAIFTNGGFALTGSPVTLLWGLVNQAGTNTWAIGTTLAAAQSFVSSNGTLIVTGPVTNGGFDMTLDGAGSNLLSGAISGTGGLVKNGSGPATLSGANTFSGTASVNAGVLKLGNNAAFGSSVNVTNAGTLDLNGQDFTASMFNHPVAIGGVGTGGTVITNSSAATRAQLQDVVLSSNATIACANTIFIGGTNAQNGILNLNGFTLTKSGSGTLLLNGVNMTSAGNITVNQGTLQLMDNYGNNQQATVLAGTGNLTVNAGASVMTYKWGPTLTVTMPLVLNGGTLGSGWPGPDGATFACPMLVNSNSTINLNGGGYGNGTFSGNITGNGGLTVTGDGDTRIFTGNNSYGWTTISAGVLQIGSGGTSGTLGLGNVTNNAALTFNRADILPVTNRISGTGSLTQNGTGTLALFGTNTYTGTTTVNAGTLLVNGMLSTNATTVATNATLGGTGSIGGAVTVQNGGTLAPGNGGISRLTISNQLVLAGQALMDVSKNGGSATNDQIFVTGALTEGGTLTVTNIGTNALAGGDSFRLFNASSYSGAFTSLILPALSTGSYWNTNSLAASGTISVTNLTYTLIYAAGANGTISGTTPQTIGYGAIGAAVTAVPNTNFYFGSWSDGSAANPRADLNVTSNITVTANFVSVNLARPVIHSGLSTAGGNISFQFSGATGLHYRVEFTPVFPAPGPWQVLTDISSLAVSPFVVSSPLTNTQGFYRVGFVP